MRRRIKRVSAKIHTALPGNYMSGVSAGDFSGNCMPDVSAGVLSGNLFSVPGPVPFLVFTGITNSE